MKKILSFSLILILSLAITMSASAQAKKTMKEVTVTGEIIDTKCYLTGMMGGRGEDHKQCAIDCIKGGLPVGIVENKTNKVYVVVPKPGTKGANEELLPYAAQTVKLTGTVVEKGGEKLFVYSKVEEAK
jgi:hypothetical protein